MWVGAGKGFDEMGLWRLVRVFVSCLAVVRVHGVKTMSSSFLGAWRTVAGIPALQRRYLISRLELYALVPLYLGSLMIWR